MAWDIQINPQAEAHHISDQLVEALDALVADFDIRYCALEPSKRAIAALRRVHAQSPEEQQAIDQIVAELERREPVELLIGH